jgi:16S rRNA (uracil1498-N3)-methyltransferase
MPEDIAKMAERFYVNSPLAPGQVTVGGDEARHLAAVCRVRPGDRVCLFNGDGREYPAVVRRVARRTVDLDISSVEQPDREIGFRLEIAAPLPKGDRAQFLIEKLTELGVTAFTPLHTERSVVHPREAKLDRLERHVIEASKQCGRNMLMHIAPLTDWSSYCRGADLPAARVLAHPQGAATSWPTGQDIALAVGPEGGFTDDEVRTACAAGWQTVSLGQRILRIETAAIVIAACSLHP